MSGFVLHIDRALVLQSGDSPQTQQSTQAPKDSIQVAGELGRLDFVSGLLAMIGIVLTLFALCAFAYIKGIACGIAKQSATETVEKELEPIIARLEKLIEHHNGKMGAPVYGVTEDVSEKPPTNSKGD